MSDKNELIPDEDYEYERELADKERKERQQAQASEEERTQMLKKQEREREKQRERELAKERVELMKIKSGVIEHSDAISETPDETRKPEGFEKVTNFFYHYKIPIIFFVCMAIAAAYIIYDAVSRKKPDLTVLLIANNGLEFRTTEIEDFFEDYLDDRNDDGEVYCQVIACPLNSNSSDMSQTSNQAKFMAQLQTGDNLFVIADSNTDKDFVKIILIQTYTGMRKGELQSMMLDNVNLKEQYMIGGEKTAAGKNRIIPIANCILPLVRHFYTISRFARYQYLIMPDSDKHILSSRGKANIDALYRNNFPGHCSHDSRHTFVTLCSNYGQPESVVKKIVGHAGSNITASIYTHKTTQQLLDVVNSLPFGIDMYINPSEKTGSHVVATQ